MKLDGDVIYLEVDTIEEAFEQIKQEYEASEVGIYEMLTNVEVAGLNLTDQVKLFGMLMYEIEGDYLIRGNVEEHWEEDMY